MYSVGVSSSTLAIMLSTPTIRNSRRNAHRVRPSSLRWKKEALDMRSSGKCGEREGTRGAELRLRLRGRAGQRGEHLVARAERLVLAFAQHQHLVGHAEDAGAMRHHDERRAAVLHLEDRARERGVA